MKVLILKFGGSSVKDNINLNIVAEKIIKIKNKNVNNRIIVVVSAQGKTTDELLKSAKELSAYPNKRELDALLSAGEQIAASKLSILLNRKGYKSISLNGYQANIITDSNFNKAKIININKKRILSELNKDKIVIITGFQGIDKNYNITTLGRGGSDLTCVALAAVFKAKICYIYSDVDGIYVVDPNKNEKAVKLKEISYQEMEEASNEGAKVLHNRCVELAEKYNIKINALSTFNENTGTIVENIGDKKEKNINEKRQIENLEKYEITSIVENNNIIKVEIKNIDQSIALKLIKQIYNNKIKILNIINLENNLTMYFNEYYKDEVSKILEKIENNFIYKEISKISIIGTGISNNFELQDKIIKVIINFLNNIKDNLKIESITLKSKNMTIFFNENLDKNDLYKNDLYKNDLTKRIYNEIVKNK